MRHGSPMKASPGACAAMQGRDLHEACWRAWLYNNMLQLAEALDIAP